MTTKKQKRLIMQQRRADFEEELRQSGLRAQTKDRERRAAKRAREAEEALFEEEPKPQKKSRRKPIGRRTVDA